MYVFASFCSGHGDESWIHGADILSFRWAPVAPVRLQHCRIEKDADASMDGRLGAFSWLLPHEPSESLLLSRSGAALQGIGSVTPLLIFPALRRASLISIHPRRASGIGSLSTTEAILLRWMEAPSLLVKRLNKLGLRIGTET